jgi:hypothetical protein
MFAIAALPWILMRQLRGVEREVTFVGVMTAFLGIWTVTNYAFLRSAGFAADAFRQSAVTLIMWLALVFIGWFADVEPRRWRIAVVGTCVIIIAALVHAVIRFRSPLGPWATFVAHDDDAQFSTYQAVGRSILVSSVLVASFCRRIGGRISVLSVGCVFLLLLGSRSDFFTLGILTFFLTLRLLYQNRGNLVGIGGFVGLAAVGAALWPIFLQTRNAEILDLSQSSSWQARLELQIAALDVINHHPSIGDFGYYLRDGGAGAYSHNALSAWTNFGLLGFVLFMGLTTYLTALSFIKWLKQGSNAHWFVAFNLNLAALIQAIVASPVFAVLPALAWGMALHALRQEALAKGGVRPYLGESSADATTR